MSCGCFQSTFFLSFLLFLIPYLHHRVLIFVLSLFRLQRITKPYTMSYVLSLVSWPVSQPIPLEMFSYTPETLRGTRRANTWWEQSQNLAHTASAWMCTVKGWSLEVPTAKRSPMTAGSAWIAKSFGEPCWGDAPTDKLERSRRFPPKIVHLTGMTPKR